MNNSLILPEIIDQGELPEKCCGTCQKGMFVKTGNNTIDFSVRECHHNPPTYTAFLLPGPDGKPQVVNHSGWPRVPSREYCSKWGNTTTAEVEL